MMHTVKEMKVAKLDADIYLDRAVDKTNARKGSQETDSVYQLESRAGKIHFIKEPD